MVGFLRQAQQEAGAENTRLKRMLAESKLGKEATQEALRKRVPSAPARRELRAVERGKSKQNPVQPKTRTFSG